MCFSFGLFLIPDETLNDLINVDKISFVKNLFKFPFLSHRPRVETKEVTRRVRRRESLRWRW